MPLLTELTPAFTQPTWRRCQLLLFAAILTPGRRTIANLIRTAGFLAEAHPSTYQRVLSQARWSGLRLAAALTRFLLGHFWLSGVVPLVGDDTVDGHKGMRVYGKARHRDAVRSSHSSTAWRYGHQWVVLAVLVRFPFATRPWALPILVALYRGPEDNRQRGRPHQTPTDRMQLLLRLVLRWFPQRQFTFAGDSGFGSHALAAFAARQGGRLTLVSRFYANANRYEPPPAVRGKRNGRPRKKGAKLPTPQEAVSQQSSTRLRVAWYGGGQRTVAVVTGVGQWYRAGKERVAVRWVWVYDRSGTHRDDYLYTTDAELGARQIMETDTGRRNMETTFQEVRSYLGLETTCGWCKNTVLRAAPCLLGWYTVVALRYGELPAAVQEDGQVVWLGKEQRTFSDAITAVRRRWWADWVFRSQDHAGAFEKLPSALQETL